MTKKFTVLALSALLFAPRVPAQAQQPTKVSRIGILASASKRDGPLRLSGRHFARGCVILAIWKAKMS
jgi:hypothetical protein